MANSNDCIGGCIESEPTMKIPTVPSFKTKMVRVMRKRPIVPINEDEGELIEKDRSRKIIRGGGDGRILKNVFKLKSRNLRYFQSTFLFSNIFRKIFGNAIIHIQKNLVSQI